MALDNDIEILTDSELKDRYDNLDSNVRVHPVIAEMKKRGLIDPDEPTDTFKSVEQL